MRCKILIIVHTFHRPVFFLFLCSFHVSLLHSVTCRPIFRQSPKYAHATIGKVLQELFSMWSAPCPLLGNGSLNTFPQEQTRGTIGDLNNGAVNTLCQRCRLCFPWGPCKVDVGESSPKAGSCGRTRMRIEGVQRSTTELPCEKKTRCVL
jgi:hypothetical protein